jgi:hypothetical protein
MMPTMNQLKNVPRMPMEMGWKIRMTTMMMTTTMMMMMPLALAMKRNAKNSARCVMLMN